MANNKPRVLDVGNCDPDHASICRLLSHFDVDVDRVMFVDEAKQALQSQPYNLVLVNRLIFADSSDSMPLVEFVAGDMGASAPPIMMVSNFEDAQERAMTAGARRGFGKAALDDPAALDLLRPHLEPTPAT